MEKYNITGMSCAACQARVEKAVSAVPGVEECSVNLLTNSMQVKGDVNPQSVIKAVTDAGYGAALNSKNNSRISGDSSETEPFDSEIKILKNRFIASVIILLPLMYVSMGHMLWGWQLPGFLEGNHLAMGIYQMLLTVLIMVINQRFFVSGFKGLIHRAPNMDTLVALGAAASFGYSVYALFAMSRAAWGFDLQLAASYMHEFYFESAAMILTLITLGKMLEARAKGKTGDAIKSLMKLTPDTATLLRDGIEVTVPVKNVKPGDAFVVKPGDSIPVDGVITSGFGAVNESAFTGESVPVDKNVGDEVFAATINTNGHMVCLASKVGEDTALSKVIEMVRDAAATKAPIAKLADKVSGVFVPVVICIALVTLGVWWALGETIGFAIARAVSVLVISCPCALGLATPVAIMVGEGLAAKNGILFKNATGLEQAGKTNIIAFDKTGTITTGKMSVTDILPAEHEGIRISEESLLQAAASLEAKSEHPISKAIVNCAKEMGIALMEASDFRAYSGNGIEGVIDGAEIRGGNAGFTGVEKDEYKALEEAGKTLVYFTEAGKLLGAIAVSDTLKADSVEAIKELKNSGLRVVMLTGDNRITARARAVEAGIEEVFSEVKPDEKEEIICSLKENGKVIMVGDGINDAPALTRADIGIAIGAGTDIAMDAADIILARSSLMDVCAALKVSKATLRIIKQNLFWAFIYNIIGIPLAAGCLVGLGLTLNPMYGAAAMSLSSFCVVSNALRLNFVKVKKTGTKPVTRKVSVNESKPAKRDISEEKKGSYIMKIKVTGMMCAHCEAHVKAELEKIPGVESALASHDENMVTITASSEIPEDAIKEAVATAGYEYHGIME